MSAPPALRIRRDDVWCLTWRNCSILLWQRVTVEGLRETHEVSKVLHATFPQGLVTVSCMLPGAPVLPSSEARTESLRLMGETREMVKASAAVFEGSGVLLATARVFISAITVMASRSDTAFRVFSSMEKVAPWILPYMDPQPPPQLASELREALIRGRAMRMGPQPSPVAR
jgi:hypothetical protein